MEPYGDIDFLGFFLEDELLRWCICMSMGVQMSLQKNRNALNDSYLSRKGHFRTSFLALNLLSLNHMQVLGNCIEVTHVRLALES